MIAGLIRFSQGFGLFYLLSNALLIAAYLAFRAARAASARMRWSTDCQSLTRVAQSAVLISLLVPAALSFVPARRLPILPFIGSFERHALERESSSSWKASRNGSAHRSADAAAALFEAEPDWKERVSSWIEQARDFDYALAASWLSLVALLFAAARSGAGIRKLRGALRDARTIRHLGKVRVALVEGISVPFSARLDGQAIVAIPEAMLGNSRDLSIALRHELQHHRRGDTAWAFWIEVLASACFINPFAWAWKRDIAELIEFSCDEALIGRKGVSPRDYGSCLVRVAETALGASNVLVGTTGMATNAKNPEALKSTLRRRIEMFLEHMEHKRSVRHGRRAFALGTVVSFFVAVLGYGAHQTVTASERWAPNPGVPGFDPDVQKIANEVLSAAIAEHKAEGGFVVVTEPSTGRVLAAANQTSDADLARNAHWSLSYRMEPASIMKTVVAAAAVERGATSLEEVHDCENGAYKFGKHTFYDHAKIDHLTTADTVVKSSNLCGIKIGEKLGPKAIAESLDLFGFGEKGSAADFPAALPGIVPDPGNMVREEYIPSITTGYAGFSAFYTTPLEILGAYGAIANGGKLIKPEPASSRGGAVVRQVISDANAREWRAVLARVVQDGTGKNARSALYTTGGKTSTAYAPEDRKNHRIGGVKAIAGFVGFAPVSQPRVAAYVGIFNPKATYVLGNAQAAPVFREVAEKVLQHWGVAPDQKR